MNQESNWRNNLRDGSNLKSEYKFSNYKNDKNSKNYKKISRSPQKNTESKDYNPWDFYRKINQVENQSYIIADPFKPTKNIWIHKDNKDKDCENYKATNFKKKG
jgi:hypothetical protein